MTRRLLDRDNNITEELIIKGNYVRLVTPLEDGGFFLCVNRKIVRTDAGLSECCRYRARGFKHAWKALPLEDGKVLVSAGYGAFMAFFTDEGDLIRTFGRKGSVPREVRPYFYATFDMAVDGNILVANWQGHGTENGNKGRQLLCFSGSGEYL
ncbi:MAG: hypothetical protein JW760_04940, partial [Spirochaetales bacterium]|nr:hypothetical protein [Spirochaetales bacterium]